MIFIFHFSDGMISGVPTSSNTPVASETSQSTVMPLASPSSNTPLALRNSSAKKRKMDLEEKPVKAEMKIKSTDMQVQLFEKQMEVFQKQLDVLDLEKQYWVAKLAQVNNEKND